MSTIDVRGEMKSFGLSEICGTEKKKIQLEEKDRRN
jgi:hypothetical protein